MGNPAHKERKEVMDQQAKAGLLGLLVLAWLALSALVAVTVGKAIKAYQEPTASKVQWGPRGLPANPVLPVNQAPRAVRDRWVPQVSKDPLVSQEWQDPWDRWDL